jgi:hypothetical protein
VRTATKLRTTSAVLVCSALLEIGLASKAIAKPPTKKAGSDGGSGGSTGSAGPSGASGLWISSYLKSLSDCTSGRDEVVIVYDLLSNRSTNVPFILRGPRELPTLKSGQLLTIALRVAEDYSIVDYSGAVPRLKGVNALGLNIDVSQGSPINPEPVRPSFSAAGSSGSGQVQGFVTQATDNQELYECWTWPIRLVGDTIPTITVAAVLSSSFQADAPLATPASPVPHLPTPADGTIGASTAATLMWIADHVLSYDLILDTTNPPVKIVGNISTPYFTPPNLLSGTTYYWRVTAHDTAGALFPGQVWSFVTGQGVGDENTVTLVQMAYPQVHSLSHFNVATGVMVSGLKNPNYIRVLTAAGSPQGSAAKYGTQTVDGDLSVAPILFFSAYLFKAVDAESRWHWTDTIPAPGVGFSLASPASNFFVGASSEFFRRNVQVAYGWHIGPVTKLVPGVDDPSSATAPATVQRFSAKPFVGMTFNISFLSSLAWGKAGG